MKTIKFLLVAVVVLLAFDDVRAQVLDPTFPDQVYLRENTRTRKPIPYTYLREADVMWSKRVWRTLDLREKFNHPLYYPETRINDRRSLFDVLKDALLAGQINAFDNPALDDEFKVKMTKAQVEATFIQWDSTNQVEDPNNPGTFILAPLKNELNSNDIKAYWMKEDWFFDKQRSVMDVRILGLCPMAEKADPTSGEIIGYTPKFWVYFPQCRPVFAMAEVYNTKNDAERRSLDDVFWKRMFESYIHKESNVYDRSISTYYTGIDALMESDRIKNDIFIMEHDLWHF
ncbi:MAG: gliding motility protein GldN [Bacteroidetes bacterium]|nr:gliding motility protein GldN [Bacteroidota bacterium]